MFTNKKDFLSLALCEDKVKWGRLKSKSLKIKRRDKKISLVNPEIILNKFYYKRTFFYKKKNIIFLIFKFWENFI